MVDSLLSVSSARGARLRGVFDTIRSALREMQQRSRSRRELRMLLETEFRDLGISRSAAMFEASKPFWRP